MTQSKEKQTIPTWLDGRTIAMLTTTITVALMLGTMMQTAHARLGSEIDQLRQDLRTDIEKVSANLSNDINRLDDRVNRLDDRVNRLDDRLRSVEVGIATIQTAVAGFDARLPFLGQHARNADETPGPGGNDG